MAMSRSHLQDGAIGLFAELVGSVAGADGDCEGIDAGALCELDCLIGIGDVFEAGAACSVTIFDAAEYADLTLYG